VTRKSKIFVGAVLGVAGLACFRLALPQSYPVSLSMVGFKEAPAPYDPQILFQFTNHTACDMQFRYRQDATNTAGKTMNGAGLYHLPAHGSGKLPVVVHGTTNGWRGQIVFSASALRRPWQQRIDYWISQAGWRPVFNKERTYSERTNVWTTL
jgi:hypothetical protein